MHYRTAVETDLEATLQSLYTPAIEVREKGFYPVAENERQIIWDIEEDNLVSQDSDSNEREVKILITLFAPTKPQREQLIVDVDTALTTSPPGPVQLFRLARTVFGIQNVEETMLFAAELEYRGSVCVITGDLTTVV